MMVCTFLGYTIATAGDMGTIISSQGLRLVISLQGGCASINGGGNVFLIT
jgi:hypothetical protein